MTHETDAATSRRMAAVRSQDTAPEMALRRALHARGLRFRVHARDVPGRPDVANRRRRIAVFVDGDFWHGNPASWKQRGMASMDELFPEPKREFWVRKLRRNVERDREVDARLAADGWTVVRIWESELRADCDGAAARIAALWRRG